MGGGRGGFLHARASCLRGPDCHAYAWHAVRLPPPRQGRQGARPHGGPSVRGPCMAAARPPCRPSRPARQPWTAVLDGVAGGTSRTCKPPTAIADVRPGDRIRLGPQAERRALDGRPQAIHVYDNLKGGRGPSQVESAGDRRRRLRIERQGAIKAGRSNPGPPPPSIRRRASRRTPGARPAQVRAAHAAARAAAIK